MPLSASGKSERPARTENFTIHSRFNFGPLIMVLALAVAGCGDKSAPQAAVAPPSVTVAQPTKRTVTDWDEFTGRFEAVEEVQVRARVGGFVTSIEFRDGAFVKTGDLYTSSMLALLRPSRSKPMASSRTPAPKQNSPDVSSSVHLH